ncbi:MAG: 30S ribosomal protein S6 [Candidatus Marinimicrobia bacterium]|nr:30S ribosomal protein S6 [Candidatus Neomarinimicrobiota bacterium]
MNYYELMYIIDSSLESEDISRVKKEVDDFLTSEGSDIYSKSDWGRTRLAYEIEKQKYGHYIVLRFSARPNLIKQLREKFGLMDAVLSHLCVSLDEEPERIDEEEIERKKIATVPESTPVKETKDYETAVPKDEKPEEKSEKEEESKTDDVEEPA